MSAIVYFMLQHHQHCLTPRESRPIPSSNSLTRFPLLPSELRLQIWDIISSEPRVVEISCTPSSSYLPGGRWISHTKPPVILHISRESRAVALSKISVLKFSPTQFGVPIDRLYINFLVDTLWLCSDLQVAWAKDLLENNDQLKEKLRFLVVREQVWKQLNTSNKAGWNGEFFGPLEPDSDAVSSGLKALEEVKFHDYVDSNTGDDRDTMHY
jgi:hypothetical protein